MPLPGKFTARFTLRYLQPRFNFPSRVFPFVPEFSRLCRVCPVIYFMPLQHPAQQQKRTHREQQHHPHQHGNPRQRRQRFLFHRILRTFSNTGQNIAHRRQCRAGRPGVDPLRSNTIPPIIDFYRHKRLYMVKKHHKTA